MDSMNEPDKENVTTAFPRLFRVRVTFDTVIYAEDERAAMRAVKYGMGEIDDEPTSVLVDAINSSDSLPDGWVKDCYPWGYHPIPPKTIGEILSENPNQ